jgi:hypothetical protein
MVYVKVMDWVVGMGGSLEVR